MTEVHTVAVEPDGIDSPGDVIDLPEDVGRVDTYHDTRPANGTNFEMVVVGTGDLQEHVLLKGNGVKRSAIEEGAQVLAVDVETYTLWYALPKSAWGDSR